MVYIFITGPGIHWCDAVLLPGPGPQLRPKGTDTSCYPHSGFTDSIKPSDVLTRSNLLTKTSLHANIKDSSLFDNFVVAFLHSKSSLFIIGMYQYAVKEFQKSKSKNIFFTLSGVCLLIYYNDLYQETLKSRRDLQHCVILIDRFNYFNCSVVDPNTLNLDPDPG